MRAGEPSGSTPFHVRQELIKPALVLCGVSGCGKSTLGSMLSERLRCTFLEGDDFHPPANIATMSAGVPLTDEDRWPWLESLASCARRHLSSGERVVVACSALTPEYRQYIARALGEAAAPLLFVLLDPGAATLEAQVARRAQQGSHFMPPSLLATQLATLQYAESEWYLHIGGDPYPQLEAIAEAIVARLEADGLILESGIDETLGSE